MDTQETITDSAGTGDTLAADSTDTGSVNESQVLDSQPEAPAATSGGQGTQEEAFLSDAELLAKIQQVPELKHFYGKMQNAYGKSREELKRGREAAAQIQQFYADPAYRQQVLNQYRHELGVAQAQAGKPTPGQPTQAPPQLIETIKAQLAPELQWMAPMLANSQWAGMQTTLAPVMQAREQEQRQSYDASFNAAMEELSGKHPGWEAHEDEMTSVYSWLSSGPLTHPKYGNRLEALYTLTQLLNGNNGSATAEAARRMSAAAKNRTTTGRATGPATPNYNEQVRKASTPREAFAIAAKAAEEMLASGSQR